jgi:hypothetical protein
MKNFIFPSVIALLILLLLGGLVLGVQRINAKGVEEREWREANETRLSKYLGETVTIGGVPHTIISVHFTWNKQCMLKAKAYDKETELSEAAVTALLAKAGKVEQ